MYALGAYGAMALLAALHKATATGEGSHVEVAGIDIAAAWMPDLVDAELNRDASTARSTWLPDGRLPDWPRLEAYRTADGEAILFGSHVEKFWHHFLRAVDREDLIDVDLTHVDDGAADRANLVWRELTRIFATRTRAEWIEVFLEHGIAGGPVNSVRDLLDDPHFRARETTYTVSHPPPGSSNSSGVRCGCTARNSRPHCLPRSAPTPQRSSPNSSTADDRRFASRICATIPPITYLC